MPRDRERAALVGDLVEDVVVAADGVDDPADVRLVDPADPRDAKRVDLGKRPVPVQIGVDVVHVVVVEERMAVRPPRPVLELCAPALEEHHGDVDPAAVGRRHACAEPPEVGWVEAGQVELRQAVEGEPRAGPKPRLWGDRDVLAALVPSRQLDPPEPDEVVPVRREAVEVGAVAERSRAAVPAVDPPRSVALEVPPDVGAGQVDASTGRVREVARIDVGCSQRRAPALGRAWEAPAGASTSSTTPAVAANVLGAIDPRVSAATLRNAR